MVQRIENAQLKGKSLGAQNHRTMSISEPLYWCLRNLVGISTHEPAHVFRLSRKIHPGLDQVGANIGHGVPLSQKDFFSSEGYSKTKHIFMAP